MSSLFVLAGAGEYKPGSPALQLPYSQNASDTIASPVDPLRINPPVDQVSGRPSDKSDLYISEPDNIEYRTEYDPATGRIAMYR